MANLPKKTSLRVGVSGKASASGRNGAVGASISNRKLGAVKAKPAPEPEPEEVVEMAEGEAAPEAPPLEDESLLGELADAAMPVPQTGKLPLKADEHLLSDKSLYGDDDPLDQLNNKKKPAFPKPAAPAPAPATKGSVRAKPPAPAAPAVKGGKPALAKRPAVAEPEPEVEAASDEPEVIEEAAPVEIPAELAEAADAPEAEVEEAKAPEKKALSKKSLPIKRGVPPPKEEREGEADEAPEVSAPEEEPAEEAPVAKTSNRFAKKSLSNRFDKKGKAGSKRMAEEEAEPEEDTSNRVSRRTTKRSIRGKAVAFKLTLKHKILGGLALFLVLAVVIGYSPGMKWLYESSMTKPGASVDSRKSAAKSLFAFDPDEAWTFFQGKMSDADAGVREAAISGMELLGQQRLYRERVITQLSGDATTADAAGKVLILQTLAATANEAIKAHTAKAEREKDAKPNPGALAYGEEHDTIVKAAQALMGRADPSEPAMEVRAAAVDGLKGLRVAGVCNLLIKIASTESNALKEKAMLGIPSTAMPDSIQKLLEAVGGEDKELSSVAKAAFVSVRDQAKSSELAQQLQNPGSSDDMRVTLAEALAKRSNDATAAAALIGAFKDKSPAVRAAAVKGIPVTGIPNTSVRAMTDLIADSDENVRVETGNTLGALGDDESKKMVLEAFKNNMSGKTMNAFITALGKRVGGKDLKAIAIIMNVLESNPGAEAPVHEALAMLTQTDIEPTRLNKRRNWSTEQWKEWYANISKREKMRKEALDNLAALKKHLADDHVTYPKWMHETELQIDILEKCTDMCEPNDREDSQGLQKEQKDSTLLKMQFEKNASIDMRN